MLSKQKWGILKKGGREKRRRMHQNSSRENNYRKVTDGKPHHVYIQMSGLEPFLDFFQESQHT